MNRHFIKDTQMASKYTKKCLLSLVIREMSSNATMRHHLPPTRPAETNESDNPKCSRGRGTTGTFLPCWREYGMGNCFGGLFGSYLHNSTSSMTQQLHRWGFTQVNDMSAKPALYTTVRRSLIHNSSRLQVAHLCINGRMRKYWCIQKME